MIKIPSLKEVTIAWNHFNDLPKPQSGDYGGYMANGKSLHKERELAWRNYTKVRDAYMYGKGAISLGEYNMIWHPNAINHARNLLI